MKPMQNHWRLTDEKKQKEEIEVEKAKLEQLRKDRESKVSPEPELEENHVLRSVCYLDPKVGNQTRMFKTGIKMVQVYKWAGTLAVEPEFFELLDFTGNTIYPDTTVPSPALNMWEKLSPVYLLKEGEIAFQGFGVNNSYENEHSSELLLNQVKGYLTFLENSWETAT